MNLQDVAIKANRWETINQTMVSPIPLYRRVTGCVDFQTRMAIAPKKWRSLSLKAPHDVQYGRELAVCQVGALSDFDNVTIGVADIAANLTVLRYRFGDEFCSATFP